MTRQEFFIYATQFIGVDVTNTNTINTQLLTIDQYSDFLLEEIAIDATYGGPQTARKDTQIPPFAVAIIDSNGKQIIATTSVSNTNPATGCNEVSSNLGNTLILSEPIVFTKGQTITIQLRNIFGDPNGYPTADVYVSLIGTREVTDEDQLC